ncbi:XRE family transcriptional regulator [Spelaeicoccus albus]|uniref:Transcriptional regulator with XRE-family HTH domain n=1 Tax=Spelaeicoccus albus TaxID=1280376 RepID=A0A7Z0AA89_9MICO|nr:XRE family transcriptional regulator [Spelaeicoccus albus]NYI67294.1 transcriptional regulator with XRE-family HTH domain [Spelaeicoccus albus]
MPHGVTRAQEALYGEPLSERFGRVKAGLSLTQARLAEILGLSAPMLSQLTGARRVKIGNPAVYERLVMLEELLDGAEGRSPDAAEELLARIQASRPVMRQSQLHAVRPSPSDLRAAARSIDDDYPAVAEFLRAQAAM